MRLDCFSFSSFFASFAFFTLGTLLDAHLFDYFSYIPLYTFYKMQSLGYITALSLTAGALYAGYTYLSHPRSSFLQSTENLRGKCVWVTGASSGIGKALAIELFRAGAQVCLSSRDAEALQSVIDNEMAANRRAVSVDPYIVAFDVAEAGRDESVAEAAVAKVIAGSTSRHIDAVILNAGISVRGPTLDMALDVHRSVFDVNVFGPIALTQALVRQNALVSGSSICLVSSVQGKLPLAFRGAYSASKHAAQAYFDSIRLELEPRGITVTTILPGYVATSLSKNAVTADGSKHAKIDASTSQGMSPKHLARRIMQALADKEAEVWVAPFTHRAAMALYNLCPDLVRHSLRSKARQELQENSQQ